MPNFLIKPIYRTNLGQMFCGLAEDVLTSAPLAARKGKIQLIFSSPPFPLRTKKSYGNATGEAFITWLAGFAKVFRDFLTADGSLVLEMGNAWEPGRPVMSTLGMRALLRFIDDAQMHLCQEFIVYNNARLPGPAQWVNIERIRVKDSFTRVWWLSATERPKASNREVLIDYSESMRALIRTGRYSAGKRPSEHVIRPQTFARDNGGAIPSNVIIASNTKSADAYLAYCRKQGLKMHPARMPAAVPEFFIKLLTDPRDLVLDPFAGSNTTGSVAERLGRRWIAVEAQRDYVDGSRAWFPHLAS